MRDVDILLGEVVSGFKAILNDNLVGIYLHGSLAMGCFTWERSDIDYIAVTETEPTAAEKAELISLLLKLDRKAPPKGFEMSVVPRSACKPFIYPTPYYLHFSNGHKAAYQEDMAGHISRLHGVDPDLAAHFTVIKAAGKVLCGAPIEEVFGEVPAYDYLDSVLKDVGSAEDEIISEPVYFTLNLCRAAALTQGEGVLSKRSGGEWGIDNIPGYSDVIGAALCEYGGGEKIPLPEKRLREFAQFMLSVIKSQTNI